MLMKILKRLAQGGSYSNKSVAKELGIDESLVEQMIIQLEQLKYIEKDGMNNLSGSCGSSCAGCSTKGSCCSNNIEINIWRITEKGKKAIA
ncbi:transcriptional regulator [Clostridium sp. CX1]|uniref:Transcriptional regulator n=1 Tax=Clostridium tanneri TaxID=3037988 RepID=A0ABU4JWB3_9CLOT|nr:MULTISPECIES: transcriptional regulator [unclassified Clostridium]MCT8976779.1 transcriptional regulator [Clostridium sp. CX1]MDW8802396.1 transcriptional regulator [Clostridium sp. A1-XYC3]